MTSAARPVSYRMLHEDAAGMPLDEMFFKIAGVSPDAPVECNCEFNQGHESHCLIAQAHELLAKMNSERS